MCNCLTENAQTYETRFQEILSTMEQGMTTPELTDSISHNFIVQMIPHHRAAIEMCENLLQYTTCCPLQTICEGIIAAQTESIQSMENVLEQCSQCLNTQEALCRCNACFEDIIETMFREMSCAQVTNNLNATFMRQMIPHHMGAVRMCENVLRFPICQGLRPILSAIIRSQTRGIRQMEQLLRSM